ncbi:YcxB family protein [Gardnerella vaginalis]|uniref:YcxB family protein n=1 Tax=Gardnerella sp. DNF00038 TaxID=2749041 RepID=UPI00254D98B9|nr:YcxB family protein [Gardnerella vaginalis]MDK8328385.1 YcxB family protein [Gardnerella vaginalis]
MSDSSMKEKEKQEHTPTDEKNPLYCESHEQICENLHSANKGSSKYKVLQLSAEIFSILMIIGTVFMASNKLQLFGWITYCFAILLLVVVSLIWVICVIWQRNLHSRFRSANVERNKSFLSYGKQWGKGRISLILCCFFVLSGILTAFFGITAVRLPNQWLLQTWVYVICAAMPVVWMITISLVCVFYNLYLISRVRKIGIRIVLRCLHVLLCVLIILGLGFFDVLFIVDRYSVKQNDNGTYTEHVDDMYAPFEYYLYKSEGPFFLKYLRPMKDSTDTDPKISESEWYSRIDRNNRKDTRLKVEETEKNSDLHDAAARDLESKKERNAALKIFDKYFAAQGFTFKENYTAKGDMYFVLNESLSDITYLQYNRDSQDGKCGFYILFKASKSSDGSWSPSDAHMQNTYTYEYSTGLITKSEAEW